LNKKFIICPVPFLPEIQPLGSIFPALSLHFQICQSQNYSPQIAHAATRRRKRVEVWGLSRGSCQKNALSTNQVFFCPDFSVDGFYFSEREKGLRNLDHGKAATGALIDRNGQSGHLQVFIIDSGLQIIP